MTGAAMLLEDASR